MLKNARDLSCLARLAHTEPNGIQLLPGLLDRGLQFRRERGHFVVGERKKCVLYIFDRHLAVVKPLSPAEYPGVYLPRIHINIDAQIPLQAYRKGTDRKSVPAQIPLSSAC